MGETNVCQVFMRAIVLKMILAFPIPCTKKRSTWPCRTRKNEILIDAAMLWILNFHPRRLHRDHVATLRGCSSKINWNAVESDSLIIPQNCGEEFSSGDSSYVISSHSQQPSGSLTANQANCFRIDLFSPFPMQTVCGERCVYLGHSKRMLRSVQAIAFIGFLSHFSSMFNKT